MSPSDWRSSCWPLSRGEEAAASVCIGSGSDEALMVAESLSFLELLFSSVALRSDKTLQILMHESVQHLLQGQMAHLEELVSWIPGERPNNHEADGRGNGFHFISFKDINLVKYGIHLYLVPMT